MRQLVYVSVFVFIGILVVYRSLTPLAPPGDIDKFLHASAYAVWAFLAIHVAPKGRARWVLLGMLLAIGGLIEVIQPAFGRTASIFDALANSIGISIGAYAAIYWKDHPLPYKLRTIGLIAGGIVVVTVGAVTAAPVWMLRSMSNWDCSQALVVGNEVGGNRPWKGELLCARLYTGDRDLKPDGDTAPSCGAPLSRPHASAVLEVGSRSGFGTPDAENPRRDEKTKAFCKAARSAESLVLDAWVRSDAAEQYGPARILTFSSSIYQRNITLAQDNGRYDLRLRTLSTGINGKAVPIATSSATVVPGEIQHVEAWYRSPLVELSVFGGSGSGVIWINRRMQAAFDHAASAIALLCGGGIAIAAAFGLILRIRNRKGRAHTHFGSAFPK